MKNVDLDTGKGVYKSDESDESTSHVGRERSFVENYYNGYRRDSD